MLHVIFTTLVTLLSSVKTAKDGRHYFVLDGRAKYLPKGVVDTGPCNKASGHLNHKGEIPMKIYHFIMTHSIFGEVRILTNTPTESELSRYKDSQMSKKPIEGLFAVIETNWLYHMLEQRANRKGLKFRLAIVKNGGLTPEPDAPQQEWQAYREVWTKTLQRANFAWANSSSTFFLRFDGVEGWGLKPLGLRATHSPKTSKRLNEIVRNAELAYYSDSMDVKVWVRDTHGLDVTTVDGLSFISESFALRHVENVPCPRRREQLREKITNGHLTRNTFRFTFKGKVYVESLKSMVMSQGLIKGDAIVRPDRFMQGMDIITVSENIKTEVVPTEEFVMSTLVEHHAVHQATWDIQRITMNSEILTHEHRMRDLNTLVSEVKRSIAEGEIPEWVLLGNESIEDDELGSTREHFTAIDSIPLRWQAAGLDIRAAQNVVRMAMQAVENKMRKFFNKDMSYAKTMWLPKSNAIVALISCHGSLTQIGNYRCNYDGTKAYFVPRFGIVLPDGRFKHIAPLMGGADHDDSAELNLTLVWSSDPQVTEMMRRNGVIGSDDVIPETEDEAVHMAAVLRSPNGAGEFSFIQIENILALPWQLRDLDNVEVVDLATLPLPQAEMMKSVKVLGMKPSIRYTGDEFTQHNALAQILAQQENPNIGRAANAMMALAGVAGPCMPPVMMAPFEQLVDAVQQMADPALFEAVNQAAMMTSKAAVNILEAGGTVDKYLVPRFVTAKHRSIAALNSHHGPMSEFQDAYVKAIREIHAEVQMKSLQMRHNQDIVTKVRALKFGPDAWRWASEFIDRYNYALREVENEHQYSTSQECKGIAKMSLVISKHEGIRKVIDRALNELNEFEHTGQRALALWHRILAPEPRMPMGNYDRLIFQPGSDGQAIMDLLIPALHSRGWAQPVA
jgi:hypothetical protein